MIQINILFTIVLIFSFVPLSVAQNKGEKIPLREYLKIIEERHEVTFTYADVNIEGHFIIPRGPLPLVKTLEYLEQNTNLNFKQVDDKYISIIKSTQKFNICGYVVDAESGEKLYGATIQSGDNFSVTSNEGYFELRLNSKNETVLIRSLGYQPSRTTAMNLLQRPCPRIKLKPETLPLKEVIIQNYITKGINKHITGSFEITPKELGILPGLIEQDVLETVHSLPGILSANEKIADINVRGGTNDQNLVLWDGIRMYQYGHFFGLISAFNPYLTDNVTLSKNGTSAAFGESVSSTIDICSDDEVVDEITGGAGLNFINGDVFVKVPIAKNLSVNFSSRRSMADLVKTPTYEKYYGRAFGNTEVVSTDSDNENTLINTNENFVFQDFNVKLLFDPSENDKVRFNFINFNNNLEFQENAVINDTALSKTSSLSQKSLAFSLSYSRDWNEKLTTTILGYYTKYNLRAINQDLYNEQRLLQENEVIDDGFKAGLRYKMGKNLSLKGGYQLFEMGIANLENINNPVFFRYVKKVLRTHAAFAEMDLSSGSNKTNLRIGVRGNYFEKFNEFSIEPRLNFNHRFLNNFSVELLGEMKSQTVSQMIDLQNDFLGVENRRWRLYNGDDIPIIKSKQLSAGLNFENQGFLITLDGYYKYVEGITTSSQGFQNQFQFVRSNGSYDSYGIDFLISKRIQSFGAWLSYSYSKSTYTFPELTPSEFASNLDITHAVDLATSYQINNLELSAGIKWHTGIPVTGPVPDEEILDGEINYDEPNEMRLNNYMRLDCSAKYVVELNNDMRLHFGLAFWNLLNKANVVNQYYRINEEDELTRVQEYSLGFTPNLSVRLHF